MKRLSILLTFIFAISFLDSMAQKFIGFGGEISVLSVKADYRKWATKTTGYEVFGGLASELDDFNPNDLELGFKYLHTLIYQRTQKTYIGITGKWKWVDFNESGKNTSLPVPGILIGKEWIDKRAKIKGFAIELGYQFASKRYQVYSPLNHYPVGVETFNEFPLILNLKYTFYQQKRMVTNKHRKKF